MYFILKNTGIEGTDVGETACTISSVERVKIQLQTSLATG